MNLPFAGLFGKLKTRMRPPATPAARPPRKLPLEKPSSEKLAKTVMPNVTRTIAPPDPFRVAAGPTSRAAGRTAGSEERSTTRPALKPAGLPPAVAFALEPKVERTITLRLSDVLGQIPGNYLRPADALDPNRPILLVAAEIEKGMASGKPAASLYALYEQAPEIFQVPVPQNETMQVPLPFEKVLEQFSSAQVRQDQERDQVVPQVNTPILQATIEDTEKFGTSIAPIETSAEPWVKVQPASAKSFAEAEPETVREMPPPPAGPQTRSTIRLTIPLEPEAPAPEPAQANAPAAESAAPAPTSAAGGPGKMQKISIELPPNGTDGPATERVPASSGPSAPIRTTKPAPPPTLKVTAPCSDLLKPKLTLVPGVENAAPPDEMEDFVPPPKSKVRSNEPKISLPLRPILEMIPPFQLNGTPDMVPEEMRIEFPLSLIQPQLAVGRVVVSPKKFQSLLPRQYREMLILDTAETPVQLPLHEILKNVPTEALKMRGDQEEAQRGPDFETPFSLQAKEDAGRFQSDNPETGTSTGDEAKIDNGGAAGGEKLEAPTIDAKTVVARASALGGVAGCVVTFADGLSLGGNLPDDMAVGGLCAVAPSLLQRIHQHMVQTNLGPLNAMTLHGNKSALTFFSHGNVYLTVLHGRTQLSDDTYEKLTGLTKELARTYAPDAKG